LEFGARTNFLTTGRDHEIFGNKPVDGIRILRRLPHLRPKVSDDRNNVPSRRSKILSCFR